MRPLFIRLASAAAAALLALAAPAAARAQTSPTPEGTVITNTATATYTDANSNTYASVSASASVTVGFLAGVDAVSAASVSPASPSTGNTLPVTLKNVGNGTDTVSVAVTANANLTVTGYVYNGTTYASLAALNTALSTVGIPAGGNIVVNVVYSVTAGQGGATLPITITETSKRAPATSDPTTTNVQPPVASGLSVTPKAATPIDRLPSGTAAAYSQTFTVTNNGNASDTYALVGAANPDLTVASVNGTTGTSGGSITLAAGASQSVVVTYTVNAASAAGSLDSLKLSATSSATGAATDRGFVVVRTVRAAVTIAKQAFKDDKTTAIDPTADRVLPGDFIQYKITVTNTAGAAAAQTVRVSDTLPAAVLYDSVVPDSPTGWTLAQASGTVTGDLAGTLAGGASRFFWVRVKVR